MSLSVSSLSLTNFRSYESAAFEFSQRTVLVGRNGVGKTNLLEALYLLASTKSFRADREREMIFWGHAEGNVTAEIRSGGVTHQVSAGLAAGARAISKTFLVDGQKQRTRDLLTAFPMVLFSADDIRLVDGAPGRRRRALDLALTQSSRVYYEHLTTYNRVLASRNRLLEQVQSGEAGIDELEFWDTQLITSGQAIVLARQRFTDFFNQQLAGLYQGIATVVEKGRLELAYRPLATDLAEEIPRRRNQDIAVGTTTAGPHRDDWSLILGNRPLSSFGSGGEFRSAMLAFRMAELAWLTESLHVSPVLLLDDVFSELDELRREALLASLPDTQTIITTPGADVLPSRFAADALVTAIAQSGATDA